MRNSTLHRVCMGYLLSLFLLLQSPVLQAQLIEDGVQHVEFPAWFHAGLVDLDAELESAQERGKQGVMVLFTTQGCTYCAAFIRNSLGNSAIAERVQKHFTAIGLEIFDDVEMTDHHGDDLPVKAFAMGQKAAMAPTLLFYARNSDGEAKRVFRAVGYQSPQRFSHILDYLIEGHNGSSSFRDYLAAVAVDMPESGEHNQKMADDPLFMLPPYALDRSRFASDRPLFVLFEKDACTACADYHEQVLADAGIRKTLGLFDVVRLDANDRTTPVVTPDGQRMTPYEWYQQEEFSRLPALMFINEQGLAVLKTDALVESHRMENSMGLVLDRAYEKGWSYQRYARTKAIEANNKSAAEAGN